MADNEMTLRINAKTDEFVKSVKDAQMKVKSLAAQMSEIDKQLKTESVDRVQKLSEKLELAKRASAAAADETRFYSDKVKELTDKQEDLTKLTDKQKEALLKYSEQMATAQQKANTYAAQVDKLQKEYDEAAAAAKDTESATESLADSFDDAGDAAEDLAGETDKSSSKLSTFVGRLKEVSVADLATKGLAKLGDLLADVAKKAWEAAKAVAEFVKEYAKEAIDMAADYQDALGYSEQVFEDNADNVQQWVKDNSVAFRLNMAELQGYVNNMGSLYRSFGLDEKMAADLAEGLIQRAADLKAATGDDLQSVLDSLTSVLTGGYKAGYKYGIVINEAAIKAYALSHNLVTVTAHQDEIAESSLKVEKATKKVTEAIEKYGENSLEARDAQMQLEKASKELEDALDGQVESLTQAQKEQAIYGMVMEQTSHINGQAAKESGNYASQVAALQTTFDNLKISIGEKLLPVATDLINRANEFFQSKEGQDLLNSLTESVGHLADRLTILINDGRLDEWLKSLKEKVPDIVDAIHDFAVQIGEFLPQLMELTERLLSLFGIQTEAEKTKYAFIAVSNDVERFAKRYGISLDTAKTAINEFAKTNGLKTSEVYQHWSTYEPMIRAQMDTLAEDYGVTTGITKAAIEEFAKTHNLSVTEVQEHLAEYEPQIKAQMDTLAEDYTTGTAILEQAVSDFAAANGLKVSEVYANWEEYEPQIKERVDALAQTYGVNTDAMDKAVGDFAETNGLKVSDVYKNWETYEPQIKAKMDAMADDAGTMEEAYAKHLDDMDSDTRTKITNIESTATSAWEQVGYKVGLKIQEIVKHWQSFFSDLGYIFTGNFGAFWDPSKNDGKPHSSGGGSSGGQQRAGGGPALPGQLYQVNDDHGRRIETFVPDVPGYILDGNATQRITNNNTNNNHSIGSVNIYMNSYGTNAAAIADEIGEAVNQRLRMAGSPW